MQGMCATSAFLYRVRATAREMRVWSLEVGLQEQASNHLKLLWSKAMVVSVKEKSRLRICRLGNRLPHRSAKGASPNDPLTVLIASKTCNSQYLYMGGGWIFLYPSAYFKTVHSRHLQIQQNNARFKCYDFYSGIETV